MKNIFHDYLIASGVQEKNIVMFAFDSAFDLEKIGEDLVELEKSKRKVDYKKFINYINTRVSANEKNYLLLDEVQRLDSFEYVLNGYLAMGNYDIYVTGSNSKFLSSDVITEFRGRGDEVHVMPLSFSEFFAYAGGDKNTFRSVKRVLLSSDTINDYIQYFRESFILDKAIRYDIKGKSYISTPFKLYFEDVGLCNARLDFRQVETTHIMENVIYNELRYRGFKVDVGTVETRENSLRKKLEIDFVANSGNKRYYVQSASAIPDDEKLKQETRPLDLIADSFKKIIVVNSDIVPKRNEKGYLFISLIDFLTDPNSLDL